MKILNISQCDYANFQNDNMMSLRSVGLECDSVVLEKHPFYEDQSNCVWLETVKKEIPKYDVIQFFHDNVALFHALKNQLSGKRVIAYHTSSVYRRDHAHVNHAMKDCEHICAMPEFIALCPGAVYMVGAVDTDKIKPVNRNPGPIRFAHYPSNPIVKGTAKIIEMMKKVKAHFKYTNDGITVSHRAQLGIMYECDVYIEMFTEKDGLGSVYGNFGITALEAAALGKVVVTQCKDIDVYRKNYCFTFFYSVTNESDFLQKIDQLNNTSESDLKEIQMLTRELVVKNHSYKATGEYFLKNVL